MPNSFNFISEENRRNSDTYPLIYGDFSSQLYVGVWVELKLLMQYLAKGFESICEFNHQHGSGVA
jgi:hypothetical protein